MTEQLHCEVQTDKCFYWWSERSERSHSQVIKIEICDIYKYSTYVRIYPPGVVAIGGWLQSGRSQVRSLLWNSVFFLSLSFSFFFPLLFPLSSFSPLPSLYLSPFLFPLHARSATSMFKHFSSFCPCTEPHEAKTNLFIEVSDGFLPNVKEVPSVNANHPTLTEL